MALLLTLAIQLNCLPDKQAKVIDLKYSFPKCQALFYEHARPQVYHRHMLYMPEIYLGFGVFVEEYLIYWTKKRVNFWM